MSSVYGKIEVMLLAFPGKKAKVTKELVINRYGEIFKAFNDRVTFVVLGHFGEGDGVSDQARKAFEEAMEDSNIDPQHHLVFCHTPLAGGLSKADFEIHSEFIQDPFVVLESESGTTVLLEPMIQVNSENALVAEQLAAYAGYLIQPSSMTIEGGNILVGDDYALIGRNTLVANLAIGQQMDPKNPAQWVERQIKRTLGVRYLFWVGSVEKLELGGLDATGTEQFQPFFHLDLFLALAGKNKDGQENILLASINREWIHGLSPEDLPFIDALDAALDKIKHQLLGSEGKLPGPNFKITRIDMGGEIVEKKGQRRFVPFSYLNAHVEWISGMRRIYFPSFPGREAHERELSQTLKFDGFQTVEFIAGPFDEYARNDGSLHCISKVLLRTQN